MWPPSEPPPLKNRSTLVSTLVIFHTLGLSTTKDQFYTHPPSHPWVCIAQCQEGWVPGLYSSCKIAKALSIIIRTHPSNSYNIIHPALELRAIKK